MRPVFTSEKSKITFPLLSHRKSAKLWTFLKYLNLHWVNKNKYLKGEVRMCGTSPDF